MRRGKAATAGYVRAYERLIHIADEQLASGIELSLPVMITAQAA